MKISMTNGRFKMKIRLPYCIALNYFTAFAISLKLKKTKVYITAKSVYSFFRKLKREIKRNKKLTVFRMHTANGIEMYITL